MARASPPVPPGACWSRRAGWPRWSLNSPAATSRGNKTWPSYPTLVPAAASCGLGWPQGPVPLAGGPGRPGGKTVASQIERTYDAAAWCVSAWALAVPNWPLCPLRANCAGVWGCFSQVVFHVIKDVFYSLSGDSWCSLGQYLFFSFNIFRSIKTLPVKYSPETQPWSRQGIF